MPPLVPPDFARLVVVGASVRAAAESIRRAGRQAWGVDQFADDDLTNLAPTVRVDRYPFDLPSALSRLAPVDWLFTGGLENHPSVLRRLTAIGRLLGTDADRVERLRDPEHFARVLTAAGFPPPPQRRSPPPAAESAAWLWKPRRSAGGLRIGRTAPADAGPLDGAYHQFVAGRTLGAVYVGRAGGANLCGATVGLAGPDWGEAPGFLYGGSIGPCPLDARLRDSLEKIGAAVATSFAPSGLFGVDLIDDGERLVPLEINPRYTAGMELLERSVGGSLIRLHLAACTAPADSTALDEALAPFVAACRTESPPAAVHGKAILYAAERRRASAAGERLLRIWNGTRPWSLAADLSPLGTCYEPGAPVATLFESGGTVEEVRSRLVRRLRIARAALFETPPADLVESLDAP